MSETVTMTLSDFLLARLDEDEDEFKYGCPGYGEYAGCAKMSDRVIADVAAKRAIVEAATQERPTGANWTDYMKGIWAARHAACLDLAQPYSDHPDFREEWRA